MRARARLRSIAAAALLAATLGTTLGGCMLQGAALDGPIAVDLRVVPTPSAVDIRADGWFADRTDVYLCPVDPPLLPDPGPARVSWSPGSGCHAYGTFEGGDGLTASLPLADIAVADRAAFLAAQDWYLLLVEVDGDRAVSAIRSRFGAPRDIVAF